MAIFTFSCRSSCGSYFSSYLKEVTVRAETLFQARNYLEEWLDKEGFAFEDEKSKSRPRQPRCRSSAL